VLRTPAIVRLAGGTVATAQAELRKMRHDPFDIFTRAAQPLLWLFIFGTVIVLGKATGAGTRSLVQAVLLLAVVAIAGIGLRWNVLGVLGVLGALVLLALATAGFACLSMLLAAGLRTRERFMGIGQLITMPLFFASSALHPPGDHARLAARDRAREPADVRGARHAPLPARAARGRPVVGRLRGRRRLPRRHGRGGHARLPASGPLRFASRTSFLPAAVRVGPC
jgi:hypothetical protein